MSDEDNEPITEEVVATDTAETPDQNEAASATIDPSKGERWKHTDLTPEQQMRFNRIYGQMKRGQQVQEQLLADNKALFEKINKLEASMTDREVNDAMRSLKKARSTAITAMDPERLEEIDEEIEKLREKHNEAKKQQEEEDKKRAEAAKKVEEDFALSAETQEAIQKWVLEKDEDGNYIRPFADPKHPQHRKFARIVNQVLTDDDASSMTEKEIFAAVDTALEAFGLTKRSNKTSTAKALPNVLPGLSSSKSSDRVKPLSETERFVAKKMFPGDPEAEKKYIAGRKL